VNLLREKKEEGQKHGQKGLFVTDCMDRGTGGLFHVGILAARQQQCLELQ
jgi:hypothetical protein